MIGLVQGNAKNIPLAGESVDMIFTDPPYPREYLLCYSWLAAEAMRVLKPGGFVLAMTGGLYLNKIYRVFDDAGLTYFFEMTHKHGNGDAPTVWTGHNERETPYPIVARTKPIITYSKGASWPRIGGVMNFFESQGGSKRYHHWGQDVESARYYIDYFSERGDLVLDPFVGGGTTAVACELIGRRFVGMDIDREAINISALRVSGAEIKTQATLL
jgi:DNA modification methylase